MEPLSMRKAFRLQTLLDRMDVPELRVTDYDWLRRNLGINNHMHPDFEEAMKILSNPRID